MYYRSSILTYLSLGYLLHIMTVVEIVLLILLGYRMGDETSPVFLDLPYRIALLSLLSGYPVFAQLDAYQIANSIGYLAAQGIASGPMAKKRAEILAKRFISLPVNYAQVWGHAISQKYQVSRYTNYLEALVEMEDKITRSQRGA